MPGPLNILHVYSGNLFGGVERMLISLSTLEGAGERAHFALCFEGRLSRALQANDAPVVFLEPVRLRSPLSVLRARRALGRLLRSRKFDRVVCHGIWAHGIFATTIARAGLAPILYLHDIPEPKNLFYRWGWRHPPILCIANSETTASAVAQLRPRVPIRVVHPLVKPPPAPNLVAAQHLREQWGAKPSDAIVFQASRFEPWKGHRNLLQALSRLRAVPDWRCWIAGTPQRPEEESYKRELEHSIDVLGLAERVSFIGHRDDMDVALAASDIYCQPNETPEPYGMVFVEALYAGKPVVGLALGGTQEIITSECGILCAPGAEPLANALRRLLEDSELRRQMSKFGPERAAGLSGPQAFRAQFAAALESVR